MADPTDTELEAIQRRSLVLEHVRADRASGLPWCCTCPWCTAMRRDLAIAAAHGASPS